MSKKSFVQGAAVLAVAGIIIKVLGACFRIPLGNMIGDEGMAYYQAAYPIYVLFLTLATSGIPIAISRMVSERRAVGNYSEAHRVFKISFLLLFCIGAVSFGICFFGANIIVGIIKMPEAVHAMRAVACALLLVPVMAAFRGYFQGMQDMNPTAVSQVVEQLFRVVLGLALSYILLAKGTEYAAAGASFGAAAGAIGGLLAVWVIYAARRSKIKADIAAAESANDKPEHEKGSAILWKIFTIAVPITIGAAIMPIMNFIDAGLVVSRLMEGGWSYLEAKQLYGQLTGFAGSLINFPQVLTQSVAMSIVPAVAASYRLKDFDSLRNDVQVGLRIAIIVGIPCALGLMTLARPILVMLYPMRREAAIGAAPCLAILAFGVIFLSTIQTLTGVLQGVGKQMIPVRNLFIGAVAKVVITYALTGVHAINSKGAAVGTVAAYVIAASLDLYAVKKYTGAGFDLGLTYLKPLVSGIAMSAMAFASYKVLAMLLGNSLACVISVGLAALTYGILLFATRAITRDEVLRLPKGRKLVKVIDKFSKTH